MARKKTNGLVHFGERLEQLRKHRNITQTELAHQLGVTQRVISYYENESDWPPVHLLPKIAKIFSVGLDELIGTADIELPPAPPKNKRLLKRFETVEKLPPQDQKMVLRLIDTLAGKTSKEA